ncbi:MAG: glycosyltransferase family 1 protein, partial [Deltaproteobacteria bacterium]
MRILYYSPHPHLNLMSPAGYGTHMREMISAFEREGHEVFPLILGGTTRREGADAPPAPSPYTRFKRFVPPYLWESMRDLRLRRFDRHAGELLAREIRRFRPDVVYERANYLQDAGVRIARKAGVFHVLEVNAPYVEEKQLLRSGSALLGRARRIEGRQLRGSDLLAVVSSVLRDFFVERHGIPPEKFIVTPNAIHPPHLAVDPAQVERLREKYGLAERKLVGFVGSIFRWHGVDLLIRAFDAIAPRYPEWSLLIVGDGEILGELTDLAATLAARDRIHFTGSVPHREVFAHIALMDITVAANSHWYGSPVKIFEYGAMGRAIIAPDNGPVRDVITPEEDALLVPPEVDAICAALERLIEDPELRRR